MLWFQQGDSNKGHDTHTIKFQVPECVQCVPNKVYLYTKWVGSHFAVPMSNVCNLSLTPRIVAKLPEA